MMKKLMNKLIALGAMMFFGLTGCSNLNDAGNTLALDNSTQSDRCVVTVDTDAARAVIVAEYGESDINQWSLSAINVENSLDTYTTGNKTKLSDLSLTLLKDETYNFTLTGIVGTTEVPGAVKGEIAARKITGNTRLSFTVKPSDATSTADPNAKGMAELKFDITGMEVLEDPMTGHGYQFVAIGQSGNAARKNKNLELEFDETAKTFKIKNAVLSTGIWELGLVCGETAYCKGIYFAVEAGLTTKVTVVKENLTIPGTGEVTGIYKDGIKNFTPPKPEDMLAPSNTVQFELGMIVGIEQSIPVTIKYENNSEGIPEFKLGIFDGENATEELKDEVSAEIDGDIYSFVFGVYTCIIDTANKTYTWRHSNDTGAYQDTLESFSETHIFVNGTDIIDDLTYKPYIPVELVLRTFANVEVSFIDGSDTYKVTCKNDSTGKPSIKKIQQNSDDVTSMFSSMYEVSIQGKKYILTCGTYILTIDTESRTYSWYNKNTYVDSGSILSNFSIIGNYEDLTPGLTYKTFVKPTPEDMLKPGAEVEINYIFDPINFKLSWQNDAEGNPENAYLQEIEADGSNGYGEECTGVFQNDEYIIHVSWQYLRVNPKKKTYTFYEEDERHSQDSGEFHTLTSIKINGVDISGDFEYETFVKVEDLIAPEKEVWLKFVYHNEDLGDRQYQILFENDAEGTPEIVTCIEGFLEYYESTMKAEVVGDICTFVLPLHGSNYACIIDTANKTYTWRLENDSGIYMDALDDFENTQILADDNDITPALTYKPYVQSN